MAEKSSNGWSASPRLKLRRLEVAGESFAPGIRDDNDVYAVFKYLVEQIHKRAERVVKANWHQADDWGYNYRPNRNNPSALSNHSSGTAIDYNATRHPNGVRNTWTPQQIKEIDSILAELQGVIRWGEHYKSKVDGMHFEINVPPGNQTLKRVAAAIRKLGPGERLSSSSPSKKPGEPAKKAAPAGSLQSGSRGPAVRSLQAGLVKVFPGYARLAMNRKGGYGQRKLVVDGIFGKHTDLWVREFQRRSGLKVDGIVGPATKRALAKNGVKI